MPNTNPRPFRGPLQHKRGNVSKEPILLDGEFGVVDSNGDGHYDQLVVGNPDSVNTILSLSGPVGPVGPQGVQGIQGSIGNTGPAGVQGVSGTAATVAVGTVTQLSAGASPTVTNSGSSSAATLNFGIPAGFTGSAGSNGSNGAAATISVGTVSSLPPGSTPTVTNTGSSSAAVFAFGIPSGATGSSGSTGATGSAGTAATIAVGTTTTGASGSSASVTNSGSSSAAVFNFTIPGTTAIRTATKAIASIALGATDVTVTWGTPFADNNYRCCASVFPTGVVTLALSLIQTAQSASAVTFRVISAALLSSGGTINLIAIHD